MAKMYPEVFPGKIDQSNPEYAVYQALRSLPDSYIVFYSKRFIGGLFGKPECEIDFVIFNQRDVIICLEVKGGILHYDGAQDCWLQNGKVMEKSPDRQATAATHSLIRELSNEVRNANVDWALCFPQCSVVRGESPTGLSLNRIIDESQLLGVIPGISVIESEIRTRYRKNGMTPKEVHEFVKRMTRSIGFVEILGVRIAREAEQLIQVTQEQCETLGDLEINHKMIVHGAAGTGKTVLAQELAKRLEADGRSVLLLFYNKGIATKVRTAFERQSSVSVSTFSSFAKRLVEANDPKWWDAQHKKDDEFWHLVLPSKLLELGEERQPKFDAIIVDEGQDFKPEWYEYLQTLLKSGSESRFSVFLDEHQDIFGHWKHFPCAPPPARKVLTKNCRNTRAIVSYLNRIYPTQMSPFEKSPLGVAVVERTVKNEIEAQTQIVRDVKNLIGNEEIKPGSIVILLDSAKEDSCLAQTKAIAGYPLVSTYGHYDTHAEQIYYSTIEIFKGLEADIVLLVLAKDLSSRELANALYVQGSRAKHLLHIYRHETV
jgi:hypothetical protein